MPCDCPLPAAAHTPRSTRASPRGWGRLPGTGRLPRRARCTPAVVGSIPREPAPWGTRPDDVCERTTVPENGANDLTPTVFVLYGATGDLARRMVLPAFFQLAQHGLLPDEWRLIG
ncbi:hypothetical protein, partial [Modestobacter roseus]|uniref:hypothetical protein n=1 Tax=Modestobacter roseus TaxID=1181884 RepID=UPI001E4EC9DD